MTKKKEMEMKEIDADFNDLFEELNRVNFLKKSARKKMLETDYDGELDVLEEEYERLDDLAKEMVEQAYGLARDLGMNAVADALCDGEILDGDGWYMEDGELI